ncbi:MAG: hydrolase TatD [Anaerolineae bacterium]|nr:hydrolase TatD [Anaerolineae bacterium]
MIDFHCHLDLYPDALKLLPKVSERNLFTLVVTTSPRAWQATSRVFAGYKNIQVALGMHPEIVGKKASERELLVSSISQARFIGEVGLDGSTHHEDTTALQESILKDVLSECDRVGGRILSIHSRNATSRVLNLLEKHCHVSIPVMHWFSGTALEARHAVAMGCWFSVGPAMLRSAKGIAILDELPPDRVLPETDGPFTTNYSSPLMPWEAMNITEVVASTWGTTQEGVFSQVKQNLTTLLSTSGDIKCAL